MEHNMRLVETYFNAIKKGKKKYEIRLNDEKRQLINIGDIINFKMVEDEDKTIKTQVEDLIEYDNFKDLVNSYDITDIALETDTKEKLLDMLDTFYSEEDQSKYKALAIKVKVLEKSCGICVFKDDNILLVHHNLGHWGLPKGHVELNETEEETAIRETKEETNIDAKIIDGFREVITYSPKENIMKDVVFFVGTPLSDNIIGQECEVQEVKYVSVDEALELIKRENESKVIKGAYDFYKKRG